MNLLLIVDDYLPHSIKVAAKMMHELAIEFKNRGLGMAASNLFSGVAKNLVDSLCQRADKVFLEGHDDR